MDPISTFFIGVFLGGLLVGAVFLVIYLLTRRRRYIPSSVNIEHLQSSANILCYNHGCATVISYRVEVSGDVDPFIYRLMIRKLGDDRSRDIIAPDQLIPEWSQSFDSASEQLFYNGPGKYTIFLYLMRDDDVFESKSVEIVMTNGYSTHNSLLIEGNSPAIIENETLISNWDNDKAHFRVCKGTKLVALLLDSLTASPPGGADADEQRFEQWHQNAIDGGYTMDLSISIPIPVQIFEGDTRIWQGEISSANPVIYFGTEFAGTNNDNVVGVDLSLSSAIIISDNLRITARLDSSALDVPQFSLISQNLFLIMGCSDNEISTR